MSVLFDRQNPINPLMGLSGAEKAEIRRRINFGLVVSATMGSLHDPARMAAYLHGFAPPNAKRAYPGYFRTNYRPGAVTNVSPRPIALSLPNRFGTAEVSKVWEHPDGRGGGKGFLNPIVEPDSKLWTRSTGYVMPRETWHYLVRQENWQDQRFADPLEMPLEDLLSRALDSEDPSVRLEDSGYASSYNMLYVVGITTHPDHLDRPDAPAMLVVNFTRSEPLLHADGRLAGDLNGPTIDYLRTIAGGLGLTYRDDSSHEIATFLSNCIGIDAGSPPWLPQAPAGASLDPARRGVAERAALASTIEQSIGAVIADARVAAAGSTTWLRKGRSASSSGTLEVG